MTINRNIRITCMIFILSLIIPLSVAADNKENYIIYPNITDAYYDDLDGDGISDDVRITVTLHIFGFKDKEYKEGIEYSMIIGLTLPDNSESWYILNDVTHSKNLMFEFDLINHATQSGWYVAHSIAYFKDYSQETIYGSSLIFDPPNGQDGGDPTSARVRLVSAF